MKQTFECVEKHLYRRQYQTAGGDWSTLYYVIFTDWKKKRRTFPVGSDLKTAREELRVLEARNIRKEDFDANSQSGLTFSKWAEKYLGLVKKKRSLDRDRQHCQHLEAFFGPFLLGEITRAKIMEYKNVRLDEAVVRFGKMVDGKRSKIFTNKKVKLSTVNRELSCLRHMLHLADDEGLIENVPSIKLESEEHLARQRVLSETEYKNLLQVSPRWFQQICIAAYETCLSRGDLLNLARPSIDRAAGVIRVSGGRQKTRVKQVIPISREMAMVLDELEAEFRNLPNVEGRVFTNKGKPITADALRSTMRTACRKANIEDFTFHDFRHTAKTRWAKMGIPPEVAMVAAGHSSLAAHYRYVNLRDEHLTEVFTRCLQDKVLSTKTSASA